MYTRDIETARLTPPLGDAPQTGWVLAPWAHGRGYATEAVRAMLAWGDAHFRDGHAVCIVDPASAASLHVAAKCGFAETHRTTYYDDPTVVLARPFAG